MCNLWCIFDPCSICIWDYTLPVEISTFNETEQELKMEVSTTISNTGKTIEERKENKEIN